MAVALEPPVERFSNAVVLTAASNLATLAVTTLTTVLLARLLGPAGNGVYAIAITVVVLASTIGNLGVSAATVHFVAARRFPVAGVLGDNLVLGTWLGLLTGATGALFVTVLASRLYQGVPLSNFFVALVALPFLLTSSYVSSVLTGMQRFRTVNAMNLLGKLCLLVAIVVTAVLAGPTPAAMLVAFVLAAALGLGIALLAARRVTEGLRFARLPGYRRAALRFGAQAHVGNVAAFLMYRVDVLMVGAMLGARSAGVYAVAVAVAEVLWFISNAASTVLFPRVSSGGDDQDPNLTVLVTKTVLWVSAVAALGVAAGGERLITTLYSPAFAEAMGPLLALLPGVVALAAARVLANDVAGRGKPMYNAVAATGALALNIGLNFVLIPQIGVKGAAVASSVAYAVVLAVSILSYHRLSGVRVHLLLVPTAADVTAYRRSFRRLRQGLFGRELPSDRRGQR